MLARLTLQSSLLKGQAAALAKANDSSSNHNARKPSPDSSVFVLNGNGRPSSSPSHSTDEIERLKKALDAANEKIAKQNEELNKIGVVNHVLDRSSPATELDTFKHNSHNGIPIRQDLCDDTKSDISASMSSFSRGVNAWDSVSQAGINPIQQQNIWSMGVNKTWNNRGNSAYPQTIVPQPAARNYPTVANAQLLPENSHFLGAPSQFQLGNLNRSRAGSKGRGRTTNPWPTFWAGGSSPDVSAVTGINNLPYPSMGSFQSPPQMFVPRAQAASTLSAMAPEFTLNNNQANYVAAVSNYRCIKHSIDISSDICWPVLCLAGGAFELP